MVEEKGNQATGEKQGRKPWTLREFGGKTLWDWMQLLIVPVVLSLITVAFAWQQDTRQERTENQRAGRARAYGAARAGRGVASLPRSDEYASDREKSAWV